MNMMKYCVELKIHKIGNYLRQIMEKSQIRMGKNGQIRFTFTQTVAICEGIKITMCIFSVTIVLYKRSPHYF